ncbi:IgGFc-binding protein-like [Lineus longissimus]|uniref:IgGFc-binding protein-like n=1 Tax=Lineus longissimus TaxID=88925 RepID=UPI00315C9012
MEWLALMFLLINGVYTGPPAGPPDNIGRDFIVAFSANTASDTKSARALQLFLTPAVARVANFKIDTPGDSSLMAKIEGSVKKGEVKMVKIPTKLMVRTTEISDKVIRVSSDADIVVFGANKLSYAIDAYLALPTDVLGRNYLVLSYREPKRKRGRSTFLVATGEYPTSIAVQLPKKKLDKIYFDFNGKSYKGGTSLVLRLERYTAFQVSSTLDLTGTQVVSDRPVAVYAGNERESVTIPNKTTESSDYLVEQLPSVNRWGQDFITTPVKGISVGQKFRVLASEDDTEIKINGKVVKTINRTEFFTYIANSTEAYAFVTSSRPVLLAQFGASISRSKDDVQSDSFMALITPIQQYGKNYVFSTITQMQTTRGGLIKNFVNVVARTDQMSGLVVDGQPLVVAKVPLTEIKGTNYTATQFEIPAGSHSVSHQDATAVYFILIYGLVAYEAYGCPAGMVLTDLSSCVLTPPGDHDGVDNDCDGLTGEELFNNIDDDHDGKIDEDYIKVPTVTVTQSKTQTITVEPTPVLITTCPITPTVTLTDSVLYCPTTTTESTTPTTTPPTTTTTEMSTIKSSQTEVPGFADLNDTKYITIMVIICSCVTLGIPVCVLMICCFRAWCCCGYCGEQVPEEPEKKDAYVLDMPLS